MPSTAKVVETFQAGDEVPEWLIARDASNASSKPGTLTFNATCHLIETGSGYFLIPDASSSGDQRGLITAKNWDSVKLYAASRDLCFPLTWGVWPVPPGHGLDYDMDERE